MSANEWFSNEVAMTYANAGILGSVDWLAQHRDDPDVVVVDCPWDGAAYTRAHIPGAVVRPGHAYVKAENGAGDPTLHLPGAGDVKKLTASLGIGPQTTVITYDDWGTIFAARLWWVLKYYGHERVKVLDGGWQAWVEARQPVSCRPAVPKDAAGIEPTPNPDRLVTIGDLLGDQAGQWQVVDARSNNEYKGIAAHGNKRVGHVPGAHHLEWHRLLTYSRDATAVRAFRPAHEMRDIIASSGIALDKTVVTYCQAAVRGAFMAFALELVGLPTPRVFDGSMAEWANRDDTPLT